MKKLFFCCVTLFTAAHSQAENLFQDVKVTAAADLVAPYSFEESTDNQLKLRSAEFVLYGPIDHLFDGTLNFAGHHEADGFHFELHEGYISSAKLLPHSRIRMGQFFLNVGRLNNFHQHDWPFVTAPKVHREFFNPGLGVINAEGAADKGLEYSWLLPTDTYIDLTLGITNGYCFGHCHVEGLRPKHPLYYIHPTTYLSFSNSSGILLGASYLSRSDSHGNETFLHGIEATFKEREGKTLRWLVQSEFYYQYEKLLKAKSVSRGGFYLHSQYGIDEQWSVGMRIDGYSELNKRFVTVDEKQANFDYAVVPTLTFKPSEFSTFRLAYLHEVETAQGTADIKNRQLQMQTSFILGAHPAHDF